MVALKNVGYKKASVEKREMTIGELRHRIAKVYLKKSDKKIVILCLDDGERIELNTIEDVINFEWCDSCKIEIINLPHSFGVKDENGEMEETAPVIIIIQMASEESYDGITVI